MQVGAMTIDAVRDGQFVCPVEFEYPDVEESRWEGWRHLLLDDDKVVNEFGGFLVRGAGTVALVDLGFGPAEVPDWKSGELIDSLDSLGVQPADVTDVLFTHLHFDHIGWATVGGEITFPNATYRCHERDWPHFMVGYEPRPEELTFPEEMLPENKLAPLADKIAFFSAAGEVIPGVEVIETPGHSPGHCSFRITSEGKAAVLAGDIAHHQAEFIEPGWQGVADEDEELARRSRRALGEHLAETGTPFVAAHFGDWQWGTVAATGSSLAWKPLEVAAENR